MYLFLHSEKIINYYIGFTFVLSHCMPSMINPSKIVNTMNVDEYHDRVDKHLGALRWTKDIIHSDKRYVAVS